jgi:hexosaminidase
VVEKRRSQFRGFPAALVLTIHKARQTNVNYRIPEPLGLANAVVSKGEALGMEVRSLVPGSKVHGTVDGIDPTESSPLFPSRFIANPDEGKTLTVKTIVVLPSGRKSSIYTTTFIKRDYLQPVELAEKRPGVIYALYNPTVKDALNYVVVRQSLLVYRNSLPPVESLNCPFRSPSTATSKHRPMASMSFRLIRRGARQLYSGVKKSSTMPEPDRRIRSAIVPLKAGFHKISLMYDHRGDNPVFNVRWAIKGQNWRGIGGELVH